MRLTRSRKDVVMSGVLAGLGDYFNIDPTLIRIAFVVVMFLGGGGVLVPLYIGMSIIVPKEPKEEKRERQFERRNPREERRYGRSARRYDRPDKRDYQRPDTDREFERKTNEIDEDDWSEF